MVSINSHGANIQQIIFVQNTVKGVSKMSENPHHFPEKYKTLEELNNALIKAGRSPINRYLERRACGCAIVQTMKDELEMEFCDNHKQAMTEEFERTAKDRPPGHYIVKDTKGAPIIEQKEPTKKTDLYPIKTQERTGDA